MDQERDWKSRLDRDRDSLRALDPGLPFPGPGAVPGPMAAAGEDQQQAAVNQAKVVAKAAAKRMAMRWLIGVALTVAPWIIGGFLIVFFVSVIMVATLKTACKSWVPDVAIKAVSNIDCKKWR